MDNQSDKAQEIAQSIISELDHFQQNFKPSGGALTIAGQYHILAEPCVGYAIIEKHFELDGSWDKVVTVSTRNHRAEVIPA